MTTQRSAVKAASPAVQEEVRRIALESLRRSNTHVQAERRANFVAADLESLANSIREQGVVQPIVVRPLAGQNWIYEIVAGERRWIASEKAGKKDIPAIVRPYTDKQVLEVQLIENIEREGLNPLSEARGLDELMREHGYTIDKLQKKLSRSRAHIYNRLRLLKLCKACCDALNAGVLDATVAMLIAPIPTEALQQQALKEIAPQGQPAMSFQQAQLHIRHNYMLHIQGAAFPAEDATLVPGAGACSKCPKRTGNQQELFEGLKKDSNICLDRACFQGKCAAAKVRRIQQAQNAGLQIIQGEEAKQIAPYSNTQHLEHGFVGLDHRCQFDAKERTYRQLAGKDVKPILLVPDTGPVIEVLDHATVKVVLKGQGISMPGVRSDSPSQDNERRELKQENAFRRLLFNAVREKSPQKLARSSLEAVALRFFMVLGHDPQQRLAKVWEWVPPKGNDYPSLVSIAEKRLPKLSDEELARFLLDMVYVGELVVSIHCKSPPKNLLAAAKSLRVDVNKLKAQAKPQKAAKPATNKAVSTKGTGRTRRNQAKGKETRKAA